MVELRLVDRALRRVGIVTQQEGQPADHQHHGRRGRDDDDAPAPTGLLERGQRRHRDLLGDGAELGTHQLFDAHASSFPSATRRCASALWVVDFTVPTLMPSISATSRSARSS